MSSGDDKQDVIAALPKRLVRFASDVNDWTTIAFGEYRKLATLNDKGLLLAFGDGAAIDAFK